MSAAQIPHKTVGFLLGLGVYNIGLNLLWTSYNSILLPVMIENATSQATKGLWLGIVSTVAILAAMPVNIVSGIISDHSTSKWGRRTPTIVSGIVLTVAVLLAIAALPRSLSFVFAGYLLLQLFGNVSAGSYQPLLADVVPDNQRGIASGFQSTFTIVGAVMGFVIVTTLVSAGMIWLALVVIAAVLATTTLANSLVIRRTDSPLAGTQPLRLGRALGEMFHVQTRVPGFFWFVGANYLMYMGVSSFASYGIYYFETVLRLPDPVKAMGTAGLVGIVFTVAAAVGAGIMSDRVGRRSLIVAAGVLSAAFVLTFPFLHSFGVFIVLSGMYGAANGVVFSVSQALASSLSPPAEAGKFMAYNNLSIGVANATAPLLFGAILNLHGAPTPTSFLIFFIVAAAFYLVSSAVFVWKVPRR